MRSVWGDEVAMAERRHSKLLDELGLAERRPPDLFRSQEDVANAPLSGYTHVLRRTWESFDDLIAVLAIRGRPTVFLQESPDNARVTALQQQSFWSQGVAPLLVRVSPSHIHIYTGLRTPALDDNDVDDNKRLVETFRGAAQLLELRNFLRSVEAGTLYGQYAKHFDPTQSVDQRLVENLRGIRKRMTSGTNPPDPASIHRILGRILFTCYLEARKALLPRDFGWLGAGANASFRQVLSLPVPGAVRKALRRLFRFLGRYFRGDLFVAADLQRDLASLRDSDIVALGELVCGTELRTRQTVLPFYVYDFSVIPIETISAVYEDFIRAEDPKAQRQTGAYYTPPKLVEFTCDLATEDEPDLSGKHVLDPACGSGVFLVSAFNRMAEAWCRKHPAATNGTRARALARILRDQICGVDSNLIACQATCFSLYMAMLDFLEPREIRRLGPERLPDLLLSADEQLHENGSQTVIHADFLSSPPAIRTRRFDLILGNPPWVSRGNIGDNAAIKAAFTAWRRHHSETEFPTPAHQIACAFMWEVAPYLKPSGRACMLLPAGVLIGDKTNAFQAAWFKRHRVDKVAHLSDLRHFLFPGSIHPTVALRFGVEAPKEDHRLEYLTPKANQAMLNDNVLAIDPDDRKSIALAEFLQSVNRGEAAAYWLSYNWASPRDREFLLRLRELPSLSEVAGRPKQNKRWTRGQGFQPHGEDQGREAAHWKSDDLFLDANARFDILLSKKDTRPIGSSFDRPHRPRDPRIYRAPLVVFNKRLSKAAFSPFNVYFTDDLTSISGPHRDRMELMFLAATLVSPLIQYFVFHLSNKPVYRTPYLGEVTRFPFPLPEDAPGRDADRVLLAVSKVFTRVGKGKRFGSLGHEQLISEAKQELTEHVYSYFDVSANERILIEDTVAVLQKSATPNRNSSIPTLETPTERDRERYARTLLDTLHAWAGDTRGRLGARCIVSEKTGVAVLTISKRQSTQAYYESTSSENFDKVLRRLREISPDRYGSLVYLRNLAVLDRDRMHIVKPLTRRFWLRSAALNDADAAAAHLLMHPQQRARA